MKRILFLIFLLLWLAGYRISAQNPYIQHYTTVQGLPSNMVYQVFEDSKKFLWFATDAGVARYDGSQFFYYQKKDGMSSNEVIRIKEDFMGRIWFLNLNGTVNFYLGNKIYNGTKAPYLNLLIAKEFFRDFFQDKDSTLYFYDTYKLDIFALDTKNRVVQYHIPSKPIWTNINKKDVFDEGMAIRFLNKSSTGEFLLWTRLGLFTLKKLSDNPRLYSGKYWFIKVIPAKDNFYFVDGFCTKKPYIRKIFRYKYETLVDSFIRPAESITPMMDIKEDDQGYTWISTFEKGVFCLKGRRLVKHFDIMEAQSILQDHENNLWISSMKEGAYKIDPSLLMHRHIENTSFRGKGLIALAAHDSQGVWCTNGEMVYLMDKQAIYTLNFDNPGYTFNQIYLLKNKTLIIGQRNMAFYAFTGITSDLFRKKMYFRQKNSWTNTAKLLAINDQESEIYTFGHQHLISFYPDRLFNVKKITQVNERIYNLFYNAKQELVVNTKKNFIYSGGKLKLNPELAYFNGKIITSHLVLNPEAELFNVEGDSLYICRGSRRYNLMAASQFPDDIQIKHLLYHKPVLYLSTQSNIYKCVNPLNILESKPIGFQMLNMAFRNINDMLIQGDSLYIASDDGLTIIPEASISQLPQQIPIPYIQSIQKDDNEIDLSVPELVFTGNSKVKITFGSINYSPYPVLYSYKLEDLDTAWSTGKGRTVVYQNLQRGNYIFKLRVRKPNSGWSQTIEKKIIVRATFWQHPVFYFTVLLFAVSLLILFLNRRKNMQIQRRERDQQLITLEQKALQSMMNPHFIFNALGSIQNFLLQNKAGEAGIYLSQFARLIRQNLMAINSAFISLDEEVERIKNYLDLEKLRLDDKFDYHIDTEEVVEDDEVLIPTMIIQPFIENSIWHGISSIEGKGLITISFTSQTQKSLQIIIEDNGSGYQPSGNKESNNQNHVSLGIGMTRKRLEILGLKYGMDTRVTFSERSSGERYPGTRVEIVVPVMFSKEKED